MRLPVRTRIPVRLPMPCHGWRDSNMRTDIGGGERHLGLEPGCALLDTTRSFARVTQSGDVRANTSGAGRASPHQPRIVITWYGQRRH